MCLSSDDFRSIDYFATIDTPRNSEKLKKQTEKEKRQKARKALFDLKFEFSGSVTYGTQTSFVMIEAPAYFEVELRFFCIENNGIINLDFWKCFRRLGLSIRFRSVARFWTS